MKMEQLENGCLKIWLDEPDMQEMGLRFEEMDYRNAATREAVARLLETAREQTGFEAPDGRLVEVLPLDKGCLILMTPQGAGRRAVRLCRGRRGSALPALRGAQTVPPHGRRNRVPGSCVFPVSFWKRLPPGYLSRVRHPTGDERDAVRVWEAGRRRGRGGRLYCGARPAPGHRRCRRTAGPVFMSTRI